MRGILVIGLAVAGFATSAQAEDKVFACERAGVVRKIEVVGTPDAAAVCEVRYQRVSEGAEPQLLWHAQNDPQFCVSQASTLVGRLKQAGWACDHNGDGAAPTVPPGSAQAVPPDEPKSVPVALDGATGITAAIVKPGATAMGASRQPIDEGLFKLRPSIH
jgi:hypothetical protein